MKEVIDLLLNHRSVRKYKDQSVSEETISTILKCAQMAPTSSYFQAYSIIKVTKKENREILRKASGDQEWVEKAPLVLLFCADLHKMDTYLPLKDRHVLHNHELFTVAVVDAALAAQKALIAAQAQGLGGVVIGGIRNDIKGVSEAFSLPSLVYPMFLLCLGYPDEELPQRPRMPLTLVAGEDSYPCLEDEVMEEYDKEVAQYFVDLKGKSSNRGWISRSCHAIEMKPRYNVTEFLRNQGFTTEDEPDEQ